jgi:hypothetical protein
MARHGRSYTGSSRHRVSLVRVLDMPDELARTRLDREPLVSRMTFAERIDRFEAALAAAVSGSDADQVLADMSARWQ